MESPTLFCLLDPDLDLDLTRARALYLCDHVVLTVWSRLLWNLIPYASYGPGLL